jgi:hypothetical protein
MRTTLTVGVTLAVLLVAGAVGAADVPCPPSLIVLTGARDVACGPFRGTTQVNYRLDVDYPADKTILDLRQQLRALRWLPLAEDFLNPGLPASTVEGWGSFLDGTQDPEREIHQWMADWVSLDGQVLRFCLRYSGPHGAKNLNDLHVFGILTPAPMARADLANSLDHASAK